VADAIQRVQAIQRKLETLTEQKLNVKRELAAAKEDLQR
jgi:hypothetical protein